MIRVFTLLILGLFLSIPTMNAQEKCGFDRILDTQKDNPIFQKNRAKFEKFVKQFANQAQLRTSGVIKIPCVVHIIHTGQAAGTATSTGANPNDAQINSAISDMNDAFRHLGVYDTPAKNGFYDAATDVEFELAKRTPTGASTTGIIRYDVSGETWGTNFANNGMDAGLTPGVPQLTITQSRYWPPSDYMNIWIVHEIENDTETLGFASFPQSSLGAVDHLTMLASAFGYDPNCGTGSAIPGSVLDCGTNLNGTCNHEIGHYLNLYHTFTGDNNGAVCPADVTCGTDSDCCPDVPAHKRTSGCPTYSATGNDCGGGPNSYIHNFMDYADDACFHGFSNNQKTRMEAALNGPRVSLCSSIGGTAPSGTFPAAATTSTVTNPDQAMGIYDVMLNGTTFKSLSSYHDGGYINRIASQPTVNLDHATSYTITVQVGVGNTGDDEIVGVYADLNADGDFTDAGEELGVVAPGSGKKNGATHSITFTAPAQGTAPTGQRIRLRIISEFDDGVTAITGATTPSQGGQIEDYSIQLSVSLPVELVTFDAIAMENKNVKLNWITASEINNSHFEIERSEDGQRFHKIATVEGNGNTTSAQNYGILDESPVEGLNYYRLKQVDFDDAFEYSEVKVVRIGNSEPVISIYPNPARNVLFIDGMNDDNFNVIIYNQLGSVVKRINTNNYELDISDFSSGVYYFQIVSNQINHTERVVITQ